MCVDIGLDIRQTLLYKQLAFEPQQTDYGNFATKEFNETGYYPTVSPSYYYASIASFILPVLIMMVPIYGTWEKYGACSDILGDC